MAHSRKTLEGMLLVLKYLLEHPCVDCGEKDPRVLDFDHRDNTEKNFTIGDVLSRAPELSDLEAEIALCDGCTVQELEDRINQKPIGSCQGRHKQFKGRRLSSGHLRSRSYVHNSRQNQQQGHSQPVLATLVVK